MFSSCKDLEAKLSLTAFWSVIHIRWRSKSDALPSTVSDMRQKPIPHVASNVFSFFRSLTDV